MGKKESNTLNLLMAVLQEIAFELDRVNDWIYPENDWQSPFENTGGSFVCDEFEVHAFSWTDDSQKYNFKWNDIEVSWYKNSRRGVECDTKLSPELLNEMLNSCLKALEEYEKEQERY